MSNNVIIIDLEATCCDKYSFPKDEMEIIEIGAVSMDRDSGKFVSQFESFVRPVRNPILTEFCTSLTTITQSDVDGAEGYPQVAEQLVEWLEGENAKDFCSWGDFDRIQFQKESEFHSIPYPFGDGHRNLKTEFAEVMNLRRAKGVSGALRQLNLEFEGTAHRALDDAINIAEIYNLSIRTVRG